MRSGLFKVEGAGNDFLLGVGDWARRLIDDVGLVISLCDRRRGVGADGALSVFPDTTETIRLVHTNADGSPSAFCANGTRCAALAAVDLLGLPRQISIATGWAEIPAEIGDGEVTLELPPPSTPIERTLDVDDRRWTGHQLELGVPHFVTLVDDLDALPIEKLAPPLRRHPDLGPGGANIHFVEQHPDHLRLRSFERGVEAETMCCGSGVVAASLLALGSTGGRSLQVEAHSGDRLFVEALADPPVAPSRLTGPVRLVAEIDPLS